jgi:phytoene dehydrogenase-like protein
MRGAKVEKLLVENGAARGVMTEGKRIEADAVIIASDTLSAVPALFETPLCDEWIKGLRYFI